MGLVVSCKSSPTHCHLPLCISVSSAEAALEELYDDIISNVLSFGCSNAKRRQVRGLQRGAGGCLGMTQPSVPEQGVWVRGKQVCGDEQGACTGWRL